MGLFGFFVLFFGFFLVFFFEGGGDVMYLETLPKKNTV